MVSVDQNVPRGGGKYLVGRPYTIAGRRYYPTEAPHESQVGNASYYGAAFHGRKTANGEIFDMQSISAAHPTMPIPSYARVTNLANGRSIIVRVNDRGPYHGGRILDVAQRVAEALDFKRAGTARIRLDYVGKAGLGGSDDRKLLATLRTDGQPATLDGGPAIGAPPVLVARDEPRAPVRPEPQRVAFGSQQAPLEPRVRQTPVTTTTIAATAAAAAPEEQAAPAFAESTPGRPSRAPLPPNRPFDLGTIPGAAVPIAASRSSAELNDAVTPGAAQLQRGEPIAR